MYGREARFPLEVEVSEGISSETQLADVQSAVSRLQEVREKIFPNASRNISASQNKQKKQYRRRKGLDKRVTIKEGDLVLRLNMLKRTKKGHKHEDTWTGTLHDWQYSTSTQPTYKHSLFYWGNFITLILFLLTSPV